MTPIVPYKSITHLHLLGVLSTEIAKKNISSGCIRILDAGCGDGCLVAYIYRNLVALFPATTIEVYGYDVVDHGVQVTDYFLKTLAFCKQQCPDVPWDARLKLITHDQVWPFEAESFDFVVSNQVLEHVVNHGHFFSEHHRALKIGGCGVHLFPLRHYIYEGHLLIPFVHRISDWSILKAYIRFMSKIGIGKYWKGWGDLDHYAEAHADYMLYYTNYLTYDEVMSYVKRSGLRPSMRYTKNLYLQKLRQIFGMEASLDLVRCGQPSFLANHFLKYISSVTLFVEKNNTYRA